MIEFIVALDGPAGSGKSTVAKKIAEALGFIYIDTGAMYRMITFDFMKNEINPEDKKGIASRLEKIELDMDGKNFFVNGMDVTEIIRGREISGMVSSVAQMKQVREKLVDLQRKIAGGKKAILDGRDIGTVVFPNANLKIYLDASPYERAKRRMADYEKMGESADYAEILKEIITRDKVDMERAESPLKKAEDALVIDTDDMSIDEVTAIIGEMIEREIIKCVMKNQY